MVSAGSYILSARGPSRRRPLARFQRRPPPPASAPHLERRPSPPRRGNSRHRPADLALRDPRHLQPLLRLDPRRRGLCLTALVVAAWPRVLSTAGRTPRVASPRDCRAAARSHWLADADHRGGYRCRLRPLGPDDEGCAGPRHLQLRLPLVPHALRGGHGAEPLRDRDALHRHGLHQLVLSAELRAAARGWDPADAPRHALAVPQLRLAGDRVPGGLVHRAAVRAGAPDRRRGGDRLECHTLVVREPGAAKNDLAAAALLLAAIAILVNAWAANRRRSPRGVERGRRCRSAGRWLPPGWPSASRPGPR